MFKKILFLFFLLTPFYPNAKELRFSQDDADLELATKFLKTAFENAQDSFVVSPLSAYAATVLLANGAEGTSKKELQKHILESPKENSMMIGVSREDGTIDEFYGINSYLRFYKDEKSQFEINNSIWGDDFKLEYQEKMAKDLLSETKPLPPNTLVIDEWIKEKTKGRIQNMLGNEPTQKDTLILVNTVYFKDKWLKPFETAQTRLHDFHSLDGQLDQVHMMSDWDTMDYYQDNKMQAVRLPYKNGDVLQIFLPKEGMDFRQFIKELSTQDLYLDYLKVPVHLELPRFNLEYKLPDMANFFKEWGVQTVFDPTKADLSKLSDTPHYVAIIIHQANIGVNEEGTEASAATVMELLVTSLGPRFGGLERKKPFIPFIADRPFIFMINNGDFIGVYIKGKRFEEEKKASN